MKISIPEGLHGQSLMRYVRTAKESFPDTNPVNWTNRMNNKARRRAKNKVASASRKANR